MSATAATMRRAAFAALVDSSGEDLLYRDGIICAVVNLAQNMTPVDRGNLEFGSRTQAVVEWLRSDDDLPPRANEYFEESCGDYYRILGVRRTDISWVCECVIDSPESDE